jgi:hypothetical protein
VNVPGDYDADGDVDGNDFLAMQRGEQPKDCALGGWQNNFGEDRRSSPCIQVEGDYDGDGDVDGNDFLAMQRGQTPVRRECPDPIEDPPWPPR